MPRPEADKHGPAPVLNFSVLLKNFKLPFGTKDRATSDDGSRAIVVVPAFAKIAYDRRAAMVLRQVQGELMTDSSAGERSPAETSVSSYSSVPAWVFTTLRVHAVALAILLAWYVAGHWDRWTGAAPLRNDG